MPSDLQVDNIKDGSATKTLATLSSSAVTLSTDVTVPASVGGSLVLIKGIPTSAVANIIFEHGTNGVVFDGTYKRYIFELSTILPATANKLFRVQIGSSSDYDAEHKGAWRGFYSNNSGTDSSDYNVMVNEPYLFETNNGNALDDDYGGLAMTLNLYNPASANFATHYTYQMIWKAHNGWWYGGSGVGTTLNHYTVTRIKFFWESGVNFATGGQINLYGVKDA